MILTQKIEEGLPQVGWKATIENLDAWLTQSAANAAEDLRRGNIPGYRAKVKYCIIDLAPRPEQLEGRDLFDDLPGQSASASTRTNSSAVIFVRAKAHPLPSNVWSTFERARVVRVCCDTWHGVA